MCFVVKEVVFAVDDLFSAMNTRKSWNDWKEGETAGKLLQLKNL